MSITIKINPEDLKKVERMLGDIQGMVPKVISRSINDTLGGVRTDASAEIRTVITLKKAVVDKTFRTVKANVTTLSGLFESKGSPVPLIDYGARQTTKGVSVQVKRGNPRSLFPSAFIATVRSRQQVQAGYEGHMGVFQRVDARYGGPYKTPLVKKPRNPRGKVMVQRLQIKELLSPRVPDYLGDKGPIQGIVLTKAGDRMHKNIDRELNYELSKL